MMLTGIPKLDTDIDTGRITISLESVIRDVVCDIARAIINHTDPATFNALDEVGMTLEAIDLDNGDRSQERLAQHLFDALDTAMGLLELDLALVMGPRTARALGLALLTQAETVVSRVA